MSLIHDHDFHPPIEKGSAATPEEGVTNSPLAVVSLVFGILGFTALPLVGSLIAVVTGHAAMGQIRDEGGRVGGRALARSGLTLGYLAFAVAAAIVGVVIWFTSFAYQGMQSATIVSTPAPAPQAAEGVKMVNELERGDFRLIKEHAPGVKKDEIIACYNAGPRRDDPEFALLTTRQILYLKDGRTTAFDLKDVESLKDDAKYEASYNRVATTNGPGYINGDNSTYHIEVKGKGGPRIRINIRPEDQGQPFFDALEAAWKAAGGAPTAVEKTAG